MKRIGFLVNPIAGMGGRVGLKGTDGVVQEARSMGAEPVAPGRAVEMLLRLREIIEPDNAEWLTCCGEMGARELTDAGYGFRVVYDAPSETSRDDTLAAARAFVDDGAEIIVFCGGDGTARDVVSAVGESMPVLGVPAGVKMHSGVFGVNPAGTAEVLARFLKGEIGLARVEIMDLDEERYRQGEWVVRLYGMATTPFEPTLVQSAKMMVTEASDDEIKDEIGEYIEELVREEPDTLFILGPGGTVEHVGRMLGMDKSLLGVDAIAGGQQVGKDLNEEGLLKLIENYKKVRLIVSPIGAQGFVLGRGNLQLSPRVIRRIGRENIMVISTPAKLQRTPVLRFDTGDAELDRELAGRGWFSVVIGYRLSRLAPVEV